MICQRCQKKNPKKAIFCAKCGARLSSPEQDLQVQAEGDVHIGELVGQNKTVIAPAVTNTGPGATATLGGVAAGSGGAAVAGNVYGDIIIHHSLQSSTEPVAALSDADKLNLYLNQVQSDHRLLRLGGISSEASDPQKQLSETRNPGTLADVFIPLRIDRFQGESEKQRSEVDWSLAQKEQLTAIQALGADDGRQVVLLGQPGAGKSSVLHYLAFRLAQCYQDSDLLPQTLPQWQAGLMLPIFVPLARLADALTGPELGLQARAFVDTLLETSVDTRGLASWVWKAARERGVLFLFDGLDEVALDRRAAVKAAIQALLAPHSRCRAVVTCRTFSYGDERWRLEGWPAYQLESLSVEEQKEFIERWYAALAQRDPAGQSLYAQKRETLGRAVFSGDARQLEQISHNPLLLTLITIVHTHREELPRSRIRIYEECVELLLLRWQTRRQPNAPRRSVVEAMTEVTIAEQRVGLETRLMRGLYEMAYRAREGQGLRQGETTLVNEFALRAALTPKLGAPATDVFIDYCQSANGLLLAQGSRRLPDRPADEAPTACFALPHPSFEEYLAARYVATLDQPAAHLAERNAGGDRWFFVGLFLAEYQALVSQRPRDVLDLVDELLRVNPQPVWRNIWLAGVIWPMFCAEFPDRRGDQTETEQRLIRQVQTLCETGQLPPRERADAAQALALLGDPRDVEALIEIPAGPFDMGCDDKGLLLDERPPHTVDVPAFRIGRYPVTVGQWRGFVAATQYTGDKYALDGYANHPVVRVSWHDAHAYCNWLTQEWRRQGKIGSQYRVRLPTEAEWEKAARGLDRREWPWGNTFEPDRANTAESGLGRTCAVGIFPAGVSPYGVHDLVGNVWEWTQSKPQRYPYRADDGREDLDTGDPRVLRGGSFFNVRGDARCASRLSSHPVDRNANLGFRVVVVSPGSRS